MPKKKAVPEPAPELEMEPVPAAETVEDPEPLLSEIRSFGVKAGLAFNPDWPVEKVFPHLKSCDFILGSYADFICRPLDMLDYPFILYSDAIVPIRGKFT